MVTCGVCEELNLFLGDSDVLAVTKVLANMSHEVCLIFDDGCHDFSVAEMADQLRTWVVALAEPHLLMSAALGVQEQRD